MPTRPTKKSKLYRGAETTSYERIRSADEYHTARWTRYSKAYRSANPLCELCGKKGVVAASEVVDHVVPFPVCLDFWDEGNWQALCKKCNAEKGNRDKKIIGRYKKTLNQ